MAKYKVDVSYTVTGSITVEATSPEEALKKAEKVNTSDVDGEYLADSWMVDEDSVEEQY